MNSSAKLININSRQLLAFLEICRHQSFARAAERVHLSASGVSMLVKELEQQVGARLFERTTRSLTLTEAGRLLLPQAERTLAAAQDAADSVREVRELASGTASFGTFGNAPYYLLSDLVQDFRSRYPHVRVRLIGQNSSEVADAVRDGNLEAGLIVLPIDDRGLDIEPAIDDELLYLDDRSGRWNLQRLRVGHAARPVAPADADTGGGLWVLGNRWYQPLDDGRVVAVRTNEADEIVLISPDGDAVELLTLPITAGARPTWLAACSGDTRGSLASARSSPRYCRSTQSSCPVKKPSSPGAASPPARSTAG